MRRTDVSPTTITPIPPRVATRIPQSFHDLADCPPVAALTTVMPDGQPQTTAVWCNFDGTHVLVNCMRGFRKERNMRRNPRVTLLCYDPREPLRSLEVRGRVVEMTEVGAGEHLNQLSLRYTANRPISATAYRLSSRLRRRLSCAGSCRRTSSRSMLVMNVEIPTSHRDLLTRALPGVLTTMLPDGQPQSSLVWLDYDGECVCVNTTRQRQKGKNMQRNPKVSLLVVDPDDTGRYLQIRGEAELLEERALDHLERLTRKYTRYPSFYGCIYPLEQQFRETRLICRIHANAITCDAIHH